MSIAAIGKRMPAPSALVLLLAFGCSAEVPESEPQLRPVRLHRVEASKPDRNLVYAGVTKASIESRLSFRVAGTVTRVAVKLGDRVRRGQILAQLDAIDFELSVEQAEASEAQARASLRRAEADFDRTRALYENNNAAKAELDAARATAESAKAQVEAASKALAQTRQQVTYTRLVAPLDGAIAEVEVEVNENVSAGQETFRLSSGASPEVEVGVPGQLIATLKEGAPVVVRIDALPGESFPARITEVGIAAIGATTFPVTVRFDPVASPGIDIAAIRSGMAAEVAFQAPASAALEGVFVPLVAVGEDQNGRYVFVLDAAEGAETGVVHRRRVEIGGLANGGLEVTSGLAVGERVVTAGVRRLADGMEVRVGNLP